MVKVIIAGGRYVTNYDLVKYKCNFYLGNIQDSIEIVSGRCDTGIITFTTHDGIDVCGADGLGEKYADEREYNIKVFLANWKLYGRSAGPRRNKDMAEYCGLNNYLILFWDGKSNGSANMLKQAKINKMTVREVLI